MFSRLASILCGAPIRAPFGYVIRVWRQLIPQGVGNDGQILIALEVRAHAPKHFELVEDIHIDVHHKKMLKLTLANLADAQRSWNRDASLFLRKLAFPFESCPLLLSRSS